MSKSTSSNKTKINNKSKAKRKSKSKRKTEINNKSDNVSWSMLHLSPLLQQTVNAHPYFKPTA